MALICEITIQARTLVLYNAHLESRGNDELRSAQLSEMLKEAESSSEAAHVIVAGDFNFDLSRSPAATLVAGTQFDSPFAGIGGIRTARNRHHARHAAIDWVLTGKALHASTLEIHNSIGASDHFPLTLQIRL